MPITPILAHSLAISVHLPPGTHNLHDFFTRNFGYFSSFSAFSFTKAQWRPLVGKWRFRFWRRTILECEKLEATLNALKYTWSGPTNNRSYDWSSEKSHPATEMLQRLPPITLVANDEWINVGRTRRKISSNRIRNKRTLNNDTLSRKTFPTSTVHQQFEELLRGFKECIRFVFFLLKTDRGIRANQFREREGFTLPLPFPSPPFPLLLLQIYEQKKGRKGGRKNRTGKGSDHMPVKETWIKNWN